MMLPESDGNGMTDRKKLNALLLDFMPNDKALRHTLLAASAEGIVRELAAGRQADELSFRRHVKFKEGDHLLQGWEKLPRTK